MIRPTKEDEDALQLLLDVERIDASSAQFLEDCSERADTGAWHEMSIKQWQWFDRLVQEYL